MAEVTTYEIDPGDTRNDVLNTLAEGQPWLMLRAYTLSDGELGMNIETGGGIRDVAMVRKMLTLALNALPNEELRNG